jgi:adenylate kinase family enzyme
VRRVWVIGASGSGKTTLSAEIARLLGTEHVELDALHHGPNWAEPDLDEFRALIGGIAARGDWVIDGSYGAKLGDMVPDAADTLVWIDLPMALTMGRLVRRTLGRIVREEELWNGNRETFRDAFWGPESLLWWAVRKHVDYRRTFPARFAKEEWAAKRVVRLRSQRDVDRFLDSLPR